MMCIIDINFPTSLLYFLDGIARDGDKILLINVNQEDSLFYDGFICNRLKKICLDNLSHIYV